jgi:hypothetical protein
VHAVLEEPTFLRTAMLERLHAVLNRDDTVIDALETVSFLFLSRH